jgi:thiamine biosynthesis lipoprotein ApbE
MHHLINPLTGEPSDRRVVFASVVAAEAWRAEVLTKAVMLTPVDPFSALAGTGAEGLAVDVAGAVSCTPGLSSFLGDHPRPDRL